MNKVMSLVLAFSLMGQSVFASDTSVAVKGLANQLVAGTITLEDANQYLDANNITPGEHARIAKALQDSYFAGTLKQDIDGIVASVHSVKKEGASLHGASTNILVNVAIGIGVVVVIGLILSQPGAVFMAPSQASSGYGMGDSLGYFTSF